MVIAFLVWLLRSIALSTVLARCRWLTSVILATGKAEIRRIIVQD
jgi:hypothetical protein